MKNKWDQVNSLDFLVENPPLVVAPPEKEMFGEPGGGIFVMGSDDLPPGSATQHAPPTDLFVMHVDLDIASASDATSLRSAMVNDSAFFTVVPNFLDHWRRPGTPNISLQGLAYIADRIRAHEIKNTDVWRFNFVPAAAPGGTGILEVRLIINLSAVLSALTPPPTANEIIAGLKVRDGAVFFPALDKLKQALLMSPYVELYPGAEPFLSLVFVRLPP